MINFLKKHIEVLVIFLFSLTPLLWFKNNEIIIGHDSGFRLNYLDHMVNLFYSWNSTHGFGRDWGIIKGFLVIQAPETFFSYIFNSLTLGQIATFILFFFIIGLSMYIFIKNFFYQKEFWIFRLFSSIFYMYNFFLLQAWFIAERAKFSLFAALPLGILIIYKTLSKEYPIVKGTILFSFVSFFLNGGGSPPLYGSLILAYLLTFLFLTIINFRNKGVREITFSLKTAFAFLLGFLTINSYFVIPHLYGVLNKYNSVLSSIGGISGILAWENAVNKFASFLNLLRLQGIPDWYDSLLHPYSNFYLENSALIIASFFPIFVILIGFLFHRKFDVKKRQNTIFYLVLLIFIVGLLFASGSHPPFGFIYVFLVEHFPGFAIFRSALYKFGPVVWFSAIFLTGFYLNFFILKFSKRTYRIFLGFGAILFILLYHFPYFTTNFFEFNKPFTTKVVIPEYVNKSKDYLDGINASTRILLLPKLDPEFREDSYMWGFWSLESLPRLLLSHSIITNDNISTEIVRHIYKSLDQGDTKITERLLGSLGINKILVRDDILFNDKKTTSQDLRLEKNNFLKIPGIFQEKRFGEWEIFSFKTQSYLPIFYSPKKIIFGESGIDLYSNLLSQESDTRFSVAFSDDLENSSKKDIIKKVSNKLFIEPFCVLCKDRELETLRNEISMPKTNFLPGSSLYFLKIKKESLLLSRSKSEAAKIDQNLSYSNNRIAEVSSVLFKQSINPSKKELLIDGLIKKYKINISEARSQLALLSGREKNQYSVQILNYLQVQRNFLNKLHYRAGFSEERHDSLATFIDNQISEIEKNVWMSEKTDNKRLFFGIEETGLYNIEFSESDPLPNSIRIDGNLIEKRTNIQLRPGDHKMELSYDPGKFILGQDSSEFSMKNNDQRTFKFSDVKSSQKYTLSFEYKIVDGDNSLFETSYEATNLVGSRLNLARDVIWRSFSQEIEYNALNSDPTNIIFKNISEETNVTSIRNLRITKSFIPSVYITRKLRNENLVPPKISIKKLNPTQYSVNVMNATTPYVLNFGESFDKGWKVYVTNSSGGNFQSPTHSYFGGEITETNPQKKIFDKNSLAAIFNSPLGEENHFKTNGYSNAWYIEKTGNYELVVFFEPQKYFYLGSIVSILTILGFIIFAIKLRYVKH